MRILAAYENRAFSKPIEYTLRFCLNALQLAGTIVTYEQLAAMDIASFALTLSYGKNPPAASPCSSLHIYESEFFSDIYSQSKPLRRPIARAGDLPILFPARETPGQIARTVGTSRTEITFDIIASLFFLLSRYEEFCSAERDAHGRFEAASSLATAEGFLDRPIVNEYLELLHSALSNMHPPLTSPRLWGARDFSAVVSFDVDAPFKYGRWSLVSLLGGMFKWGKNLREVIRSAIEASEVAAGRKPDPYFAFDYLMEQQKRFSAKATYFFLSERTSRWDAKPQLERPEVLTLLRRLVEKGCEIGLHGSYRSCQSAEQLRREKERLEKAAGCAASGVRQHFLRLRVPQTWRFQEEAGLRYDATLGFADAEGFRAGVCLPYRPFDLEQNCERKIWVVPLCVMDATLKHYRRLSPEEARERIFKIIDTVKRHRGVFTLLWHNSSFDEMYWSGWRGVFESVLQYLAEQGALFLTAEQLVQRMEAACVLE
jgi:peptidoglycan/xylan/chitin deacetylase (PgdA/CDA1 family)